MTQGTVDGIRQTEIKRGNYKTWYRLHPNQNNPDFFGHVMICHNLPNGAFAVDGNDRMSMSEYYRKKGFRETPQELNPDADLTKDTKGGMYLVPPNYELREFPEKTLFGDGKTLIDVIVRRVVPKEGNVIEGCVCGTCGKVCQSEFGLKAHQRAHAK